MQVSFFKTPSRVQKRFSYASFIVGVPKGSVSDERPITDIPPSAEVVRALRCSCALGHRAVYRYRDPLESVKADKRIYR